MEVFEMESGPDYRRTQTRWWWRVLQTRQGRMAKALEVVVSKRAARIIFFIAFLRSSM